jgi:hypothetical protein
MVISARSVCDLVDTNVHPEGDSAEPVEVSADFWTRIYSRASLRRGGSWAASTRAAWVVWPN